MDNATRDTIVEKQLTLCDQLDGHIEGLLALDTDLLVGEPSLNETYVLLTLQTEVHTLIEVAVVMLERAKNVLRGQTV